jgi:VanZ family protein
MQKNNSQHTPTSVILIRILFTACLIGSIVFIFSNSMKVASVSSAASSRVLAFLRHLLIKLNHPHAAAALTDHIVRKLAHFCEYMLEGFCMMLCLRVYTRHTVKHVSWPILGSLLTAVCDETIQLFSDGRSSQITDVWIDFAGGMTGLFIAFLLLCVVQLFANLLMHRNED